MHDLKRAFGSPDPNFHQRVRQTLLSIEAREQAAERKKKNRFSLSFALSAVLCVALLAAFVVSLSNTVKRGKPDTTGPLAPGVQTGMTVYISEGDPCFHFFLDCPEAKTSDMRAIPVEQALASDKEPCTGCFGKADEPVYIDPIHPYYHSDTCTGQAEPEEHTLSEALKAGMAPCPLCVMSENCSIRLLGNTEVYIETSAEGKRTCHLTRNWQLADQTQAVFITLKYSEIYLNPSAYSDLTYCSACFGRLRDNTVYLTEDDPYYHSDETHADAAHPVALDVSEALVLGKLPCPVCVLNQAEVTETVLPTAAPTPAATDYAESIPLPTDAATIASLSNGSYVYIGDDFTFHISEDCARLSKQSERQQKPIKDAINAKLTPCENCFGDDQIACYVDHAHMYYHHNPNCAGAVTNNSYSLEIALNNDYLPCPLCVMNINVADSLFEDASVYASNTDEFFHSVITCSAIQDASYVQPHPIVKLLLASGMAPCPLCMGDNMADEYVMSAYDNYYHSTAYCTKLQDVNDRDSMPTYDIAFALILGKLPCPDCILAAAGIDYAYSETADVMVQFSNLSMCYTSVEDPHYYHKTAACPQMPGNVYSYVSEEDALALGLSRCPACYDIPSDEPAATVEPTVEPLDEPMYYDTPNGLHYHIDPNCTGMKNAEPVSLEEALARGQTPCPTCILGAANSSEASDSNAGTAAGR